MCALGVPIAESLAGLESRLPLPEVRALVAALDRAARHGAPLSDTLAAQARDARLAQRRQIEEEAARAGPNVQLVVPLLLVPSVLLLVAAALAAALLDGGGLAIGGRGVGWASLLGCGARGLNGSDKEVRTCACARSPQRLCTLGGDSPLKCTI